jgi:acetoin utilization deacetylase AcuC-like enzyme
MVRVKVYYGPDYVLSRHAFDTTRKAKWIADSLSRTPISGVELVEPMPLGGEELTRVHDPEYVRAVETGNPRELAESQGFPWDPGLWPMVRSSNGGAVAAAGAALQDGVAGSLSSGLHHARRWTGAGFCTFNGLVLAAKQALAEGARSVLILDLDAHCGGGTASLIERDPSIWMVDVSVNGFDCYSGSDRARLEIVEESARYLAAIRDQIETVDRLGPALDLCLYNAGMDPFEGCSTGGLAGVTREILADRERMVFEWCRARRLPIAFVLAGGYVGPGLSEEGLVQLHRLTLEHASRS